MARRRRTRSIAWLVGSAAAATAFLDFAYAALLLDFRGILVYGFGMLLLLALVVSAENLKLGRGR